MKLLIYIFLKILNFRIKVSEYYEIKKWQKIYDFSEPFPTFIKRKVLETYNSEDAIWVETGTLVGETAEYLSKISKFVYTIEPSEKYFEISKKKLGKYKNISIYNNSSEQIFEKILLEVQNNQNVCLWLDGHWSGGDTFKGLEDTPIKYELDTIEKHLSKFSNLNILIDDFRLFDLDNNIESYPPKEYLINFAKKNDLKWDVSRDIFILIKK